MRCICTALYWCNLIALLCNLQSFGDASKNSTDVDRRILWSPNSQPLESNTWIWETPPKRVTGIRRDAEREKLPSRRQNSRNRNREEEPEVEIEKNLEPKSLWDSLWSPSAKPDSSKPDSFVKDISKPLDPPQPPPPPPNGEIDLNYCSKHYNERGLKPVGANLPPPALWTFPGCGNTWSRCLLEYATGYLTGTVYGDKTLKDALPGEFMCDQRNVAIKVHPTTHNFKYLERGGYHRMCKTVKHFNQAILIIRDPFDSFWSEYIRRVTNSHVAKINVNNFNKKNWYINAKQLALQYKDMWINSYGPFMHKYPNGYLLIKYEDLINPSKQMSLLEEMLTFMKLPTNDANRLKCAFLMAKKPSVKRPEDEYVDGVKLQYITKEQAFTESLVCKVIWPIISADATKYGYHIWKGTTCSNVTESASYLEEILKPPPRKVSPSRRNPNPTNEKPAPQRRGQLDSAGGNVEAFDIRENMRNIAREKARYHARDGDAEESENVYLNRLRKPNPKPKARLGM